MADNPSGTAEDRILLPSHVVPVRYDLSLTPDLEAFTFTGAVVIEYSVEKSKITKDNANVITLHAKELCFESVEYVVEGQPPVKADEIQTNLKDDTVKFTFGTAIPESAENIRVTIKYAGFLNNQMAGFYRSSYTDIQGKSQIMGTTQFEPLDARRAFPCVDEPAAKAVFGLSMTIPSHLHCFSNMPESAVVSVSASNKKVTFLDSPKMSSYLLAFCVGEVDCVQAQTAHGVMVKVYTTPGKGASGTYALDCACRCLDNYDDFFGTPYPLPKLDMVAIPDFAMGAMENWGLVTYREVDLLIDPVTASSQQKQRVATVVCHELAHQWFGNLVTMAWWSSLWLNESFASWCENWATDKLFPDYAMWEQFTTGRYLAALRLDSLKSSHPIEVPISRAEEVEQVFDAISYSKGASVIRMIQNVLGMKNFQTGLAAYMKKHAYGNTETRDLWAAWEEASGMPVGELMASWTNQMGFPLLKVTKEDWQDDKVVLEVSQSWFLSDGSELDAEGAAKAWTIPVLTCTDAGAQEDMTLMREKTATITVPISTGGWAKLNAGSVVPMRVLPGDQMLERLAIGIKSKAMSPIDRSGLLNDAYALVKAGHISPETLMKLLDNYKDEDHYVVWEGLAGVLLGLDALLLDDEAMSEKFRQFAKGMSLKLVDVLGWQPKDADGHLTTLHRAIMGSLLARFAYDDDKVASEALSRFRAFQRDPADVKSLPSDMRVPVFKIVLKNKSLGAAIYEEVKSYYYTASDNAERKHVLNSLGATPDPSLKLATMDWTTSGEVKLQDFFYAMGSVGRSSLEGREISWKYFQDNFDKIQSLVANASPSLMAACIVFCAGGFCSREKADEIDAFFAAHPLPKSTRKIAQTTESMRANAKFFDVIKASELSKPEFWDSL